MKKKQKKKIQSLIFMSQEKKNIYFYAMFSISDITEFYTSITRFVKY